MTWQRLGEIPSTHLSHARHQGHWAVQVLSAAGETFLAAVPDTSHTAMTWDARQAALVGRELPGSRPCRVALRLADLTLLLLDHTGPVAQLALPGLTLDEAYRWTATAVKTYTRGAHDRALAHPGYELDPHPLASKGCFARDPGAAELARWYANAALVLARFERETPDSGEVLCWPHHFDLASLVVLERDRGGEALRTVGVGFSPGDSDIDEPYWYVNHGPETERQDLPSLSEGEWFRDGWIGAVLRGSRLSAASSASAQEGRLQAYLASAFPASCNLALETPLE